jgi:YD repeat-containing protein
MMTGGTSCIIGTADHEKYYSYVNTNSSNIFVDSGGNKVCKFTDAFYSFTVNNNTHNLVMGKAESPAIEEYYKYGYEGNLEETKRLCDEWSITKNTFDKYGNLVKSVDPENHIVYYDYDSSYNNAYLTATHRLLESQNVTEQYQYNFTTGDLNRATDAKGNQTDYTYDVYGRITNVTLPKITSRATKNATYYDTIAFTDLSPNKTTVDTTTGYIIRTFHDVGRSWVMWVEEDELRYSSENDGEWSDASTVPSTNGEARFFDLFFDGTFVHLAFTYCADEKDIYYMRGTPRHNGTIN